MGKTKRREIGHSKKGRWKGELDKQGGRDQEENKVIRRNRNGEKRK